MSGLTLAVQKSWKNMGMMASIVDCGRSWEWGCRGRLVLGFKPRHVSHDEKNHMALTVENYEA